MAVKRQVIFVKHYLLCFLCFFISPAWTNQSFNKQWSSLTLMGNYGAVLYNVEPQFRLIDNQNDPFQQFLTNAGLGYKTANDWSVWLGQTWGTVAQDASVASLEEYRIWEQLMWNHSFSYVTINSRTRLEERKSLAFADWANRIRERVLVTRPLTTNMSLVVSNEIFVALNKAQWVTTQTIDQNRAYMGIEQRLSKIAYLSAGYMNQYLSTKNRQFDNVLVVNLRIDLSK